MSLMASFVLSFYPRDVLDEIWDLIGSVSEGFPSYSYITQEHLTYLAACLVTSSLVKSLDSDTDSVNVRVIRRSALDGQKACCSKSVPLKGVYDKMWYHVSLELRLRE